MGILDEFSLAGRKAVVTGGGKGIGRGIALCLAEAGADVMVTARTHADVEAVAAEITANWDAPVSVTSPISPSAARSPTPPKPPSTSSAASTSGSTTPADSPTAHPATSPEPTATSGRHNSTSTSPPSGKAPWPRPPGT